MPRPVKRLIANDQLLNDQKVFLLSSTDGVALVAFEDDPRLGFYWPEDRLREETKKADGLG